MPPTPDLRRLIVTGVGQDRRAAWNLVQRAPTLMSDYQSQLLRARYIEPGQHHEFVTIAGYEFEQITHPDGGSEIKLGEFEIDYDEPLSDKIAACKFDEGCVNVNITAANFPFNRTGKFKVRLAIIHTGVRRQYLKHFEAMTIKLGRREANLAEELEIAKRFPNLQRGFYIIAFGSRWSGRGCVQLTHLGCRRDVKRRLDLRYRFGSYWSDGWALIVD